AGDIAAVEVALVQRERTLRRRAIAAATTGLDGHEIAGLEPIGAFLLDALLVGRSGFGQHEAARLRLLAALYTPGRELGAVEIGAEQARPQDAIALSESQPSAEFAGAGGVFAQRELLDPERHQRLLQLQRDDPRVAMRHGAERAGAVVGGAGAPAAVAG